MDKNTFIASVKISAAKCEGWEDEDWGDWDDHRGDEQEEEEEEGEESRETTPDTDQEGETTSEAHRWLHNCHLAASPVADIIAVARHDKLVLLTRKHLTQPERVHVIEDLLIELSNSPV